METFEAFRVLFLHFFEPILITSVFSLSIAFTVRYLLGLWSISVRSVPISILVAFAFPPLFVGFGAGYLAGYSSMSVLGSVLSGTLGLLGGGLVYVLGQSSEGQVSEQRAQKFALLAVAFVSGLIVGVQHGLFTKGRFEQEAKINDLKFREELAQLELTKALILKERYYQEYLHMLVKLARDEAGVKIIRENLNLPMPDVTSTRFMTLPALNNFNKAE